MDIISFGHVFRYKEDYYVYLCSINSIIYTAKILNDEHKNFLLRKADTPSEKEKMELNDLLYCYVILNTDEFKEKMAHLANTDNNVTEKNLRFDVVGNLHIEDKKKLKEKILSHNAIPRGLQKFVEQLDF